MGAKNSQLSRSSTGVTAKSSSVNKQETRSQEAIIAVTIFYKETGQKEKLVLSPPDENTIPVNNAVHRRKYITSGGFFSKTSSEIGTWICDDGCLSLTWESSGRTLEFLQTTLTSEVEWRSEGSDTDLQVMNLKGTKYLPVWIMPRSPEDMKSDLAKQSNNRDIRAQVEEGRARGAIAAGYNECALCFFELHLLPVAILRYQSKRSCAHYFHAACAQAYKVRQEKRKRRLVCPICSKRFTEVKILPDLLRDPRLWFQLCDTDLGGSLDKNEVLEGLLAVLPVERNRLEKSISDSWSNWDASGDGSIELAEFINPEYGLKAFLVKNYNIFRKSGTSTQGPVPSLDTEPRKWFDYWDYNQSGTLERMEAARALMKTFCVTAWGDPLVHRANDIAELALSLWDMLGYSTRAKLTFEEFMKPFGLADQVIHNNTHGQFFGEDD